MIRGSQAGVPVGWRQPEHGIEPGRYRMVDEELMKILACPLDKAPVKLQGDRIICTRCGRRYPIRDGIPVMLIDEAEMPP